MPKAHIAYCPSTEEMTIVDAWFAKWSDELAFISDNHGCGCCFNFYFVEGPSAAIRELPKEMRAKERECWSRILDVPLRKRKRKSTIK
ncbi:MAG: hypothetical protein L0Y72_05455 [Gemmataceae bacterium]|nr:hypothetical protein [Gemmataceae bacterium]MCI0738470.1 hypothetical protein [Gemmataceae bacterium]